MIKKHWISIVTLIIAMPESDILEFNSKSFLEVIFTTKHVEYATRPVTL